MHDGFRRWRSERQTSRLFAKRDRAADLKMHPGGMHVIHRRFAEAQINRVGPVRDGADGFARLEIDRQGAMMSRLLMARKAARSCRE